MPTMLVAVQTILRTVHLPTTPPPIASTSARSDSPHPTTPTAETSSIRVVERPGLNNSTGQRLWDCAICLSAYLARHPDQLWPGSSSTPSDSTPNADPPKAKRARRDAPFLQVIELGAGCGTVSLAAARLLSSAGLGADEAEVTCTDVQVTVDTSLRENLGFDRQPPSTFNPNALHASARTLDWGSYSSAQLDTLFPAPARSSTAVDRTLLGSDILYNPESHSLLLETLLSFMRPKKEGQSGLTKALIGYRGRTEGDGEFFGRAEGAGLRVRRVWSWGQVEIWEFT